MDVKEYCSTKRTELNHWKAKMDNITGKLENASPEDKERYASSLEELRSVADDLENRILNLENECPAEWGPQKDSLDRKIEELSLGYREMAAELSPDDFE